MVRIGYHTWRIVTYGEEATEKWLYRILSLFGLTIRSEHKEKP